MRCLRIMDKPNSVVEKTKSQTARYSLKGMERALRTPEVGSVRALFHARGIRYNKKVMINQETI